MVASIYGANYTIAKEILDKEYIQPFGLTLMRVIAGLVLFSLVHFFFVREEIEKKDLGRFAISGLTGVAINQMLFIAGLKYTTHINAALIMTTVPVLVITASWFLLGEELTKRKLLGIALGIAGAITLTVYGKSLSLSFSGLKGDLMIVANAMSYGIYLVLVKKLINKYNPITVIRTVFFFGLLFVAPFGAKDMLSTSFSDFSSGIWLALGYVLLFTTFFAYLFNAYALKLVSPSVVSIYIYIQPLIATAIALFFGKDVLTPVKIAAGILIFSGVFLVGRR
jgi:drug/metabolite transporter (DMT)-like permease